MDDVWKVLIGAASALGGGALTTWFSAHLVENRERRAKRKLDLERVARAYSEAGVELNVALRMTNHEAFRAPTRINELVVLSRLYFPEIVPAAEDLLKYHIKVFEQLEQTLNDSDGGNAWLNTLGRVFKPLG